jgi:Tol biopolymer transport system component
MNEKHVWVVTGLRAVIGAVAVLAGAASAQTTTRADVDSSGGEADLGAFGTTISPDGRYVVFDSPATNLVPGDTNGTTDVFLRDRLAGTTARVSLDDSGGQWGFRSHGGTLSADGRYLVYIHYLPGLNCLVRRDLQSGANDFLACDAAGASDATRPHSSADGRYVAYLSWSDVLVPGDTNGVSDVFVHDLQTGGVTRVSVDSSGNQADGASYDSSISADGRYVAFESAASNLVLGDTNGEWDTYVHDLLTGVTTRVSVDSAGVEANGSSAWGVGISADGRFVGFTSSADNLVPGDANTTVDAFVHDLLTGQTVCASVNPAGLPGNNGSYLAAISATGSAVAFTSRASDLVPLDRNLDRDDLFVRDLAGGVTWRASVDSSGAEANSFSLGASLSADGRVLSFTSHAFNLVGNDTNHTYDVFVFDADEVNVFRTCAGDGTIAACPCGNSGLPDRGCANSADARGAVLDAGGFASLASDTLVLTSSGERWSALTIFLQGDQRIAETPFGDGLRCAGGQLLRLYARNAWGGTAAAPLAGDPPISVRATALGDSITAGAERVYQAYYRDPSATFCPDPPGSTFNSSSALRAVWAP